MSLEPPTISETENAVPFPASTSELHTPAEWSALDGVTVMDPDGWRGSRTLPAKSFDEPISRDEWEQRLSISTHSLRTVQPTLAPEPMSVIDRVALRLMRIKIYGTNPDERYTASTRRQWDRVLDPDDREAWRRAARQVLADIAIGDDGDFRAWPDYEVRHPDGDVHGGYDDVSSASDFRDKIWPDGKIYRRDTATLHTEWVEVTE